MYQVLLATFTEVLKLKLGPPMPSGQLTAEPIMQPTLAAMLTEPTIPWFTSYVLTQQQFVMPNQGHQLLTAATTTAHEALETSHKTVEDNQIDQSRSNSSPKPNQTNKVQKVAQITITSF